MQRIWRWLHYITSERGSQGLEAAGVAVAVAIIAVALIGAATSILAPGIEGGLNCAIQTVLGGGGCGWQGSATANTGNNVTNPQVNPGQNGPQPYLAVNQTGNPASNDLGNNQAAGPGMPDALAEGNAAHQAIQAYFITNIRPTAEAEVFIRGGGPNGGSGWADLVDGNEI